jgi:HAD superfamily hydrolase (TIGR01549 family)
MMLSKLIIFDLDGTLFRTETVDIEAFNAALISNGYLPRTGSDIMNLIGYPLDAICRQLLDSENPSLIEKFKIDLINYESKLIVSFGKLYPGVTEFLRRLKNKGLNLCICSNGNKEYVEAITTKFNFRAVFNEIWYEKNGITKSQAIKILKKKFQADSFIMVGDRASDIEAAKDNKGIAIGVSYGFGGKEIMNADYIAGSISELEAIIISLSNFDARIYLP